MKRLLKLVAMILAVTFMIASSSAEENKMDLPAITESFVILYYENLDGPKKFYDKILGLKETVSSDGFRLFQLTPTSLIGAIKSGSAAAYHAA